MRQSFWLTSRAVPSLTTRAESPPGPSVMLVSTWMAMRRCGPSASSWPSVVRMMLSKPNERILCSSSRVGKPGIEHGGGAVDVLGEPRLVEVVGVEMRDVEIGRMLDALHQLRRQLVVAREHEPRSEERRQEPGIAQDRSVDGVDQNAGVADGGGAHSRSRLVSVVGDLAPSTGQPAGHSVTGSRRVAVTDLRRPADR